LKHSLKNDAFRDKESNVALQEAANCTYFGFRPQSCGIITSWASSRDVSMVNPREILRAGCEILNPVMLPHRFTFIEGLSGKGSGGNFASGEYVRNERRLELHFRFSLGLVTYHLSASAVSHLSYMRELLGESGGNQYPGFSDNPLDGFRNLAYDIENFADDFLNGSGEVLVKAARKEAEYITTQNKLDMTGYVGDTRKREEAHRLFRENKFQGVIENLESLIYPELLKDSEKKILEISKRKAW